MSNSLNKVQIIGNLTAEPEVRETPNGQKVATFSVATNRKWKDASGMLQEEVEYHNCVAWRGLAGVCANNTCTSEKKSTSKDISKLVVGMTRLESRDTRQRLYQIMWSSSHLLLEPLENHIIRLMQPQQKNQLLANPRRRQRNLFLLKISLFSILLPPGSFLL